MHLLAGWFLRLFTSLAGFFMKGLTRKWAITTAAVTLFLGLTAAFVLALKAILVGLIVALDVPPQFVVGFAAVAPDNLEACISALFAAHLLAWAYNLNKDLMGMYLGGI